IIRELTLHTMVEEDIFYPAVRETNDEKLRELIDESLDEHRSAKEMMAEMDEMELPDDELNDQMAMLQEDVEHHVEEEETEMFPRLQKIWEEAYLDRLGQGMWERKQERKAA
ncbi:MAG: hemerythrin domain-containing protein, partial [Nitrospiria bacterium]